MLTVVTEDTCAAPERRLALLTGLDVEHLDSQPVLTIDRFDEWTNPPGAITACTCTLWNGTDLELDRAA